MKVKCVLCDTIEHLEQFSLQAKQLRNRRIKMYLCQTCYNRIAKKTNERLATNKLRLYKEKDNDPYI